MGFKDEVEAFGDVVSKLQKIEGREFITDEEAIAAINVLVSSKIKKVPDAFLACAAYNLLNVYVKQKSNDLSCHFHTYIDNIIKGIEDIGQPKAIGVAYDDSDGLKLLIISFWNFQFSFQSIRKTKQINDLLSERSISWDGIRKQKCASTIFQFALESLWISNETMGGKPLREFVEKEIDTYIANGYCVMDGRFVKTKRLQPALDEQDRFLKNYVRNKLYNCQDRPVIISAIYRRSWEKHVTFTSVKPYIPNTRVITICDHINLLRTDVESVLDIEELIPGTRYYIIGHCRPYPRVDRMGVQLAVHEGFCPIFGIKEYYKIPSDLLSRCHRFSIEEYLSVQQKELKL